MRPETVVVSVPPVPELSIQANSVIVPPQVPDKTWNTASYPVEEATVIVAEVAVGVNLKNTSSSAGPTHEPNPELVAPHEVDETGLHVVPKFKRVALNDPVHPSLVGWGHEADPNTQIVKLPVVP